MGSVLVENIHDLNHQKNESIHSSPGQINGNGFHSFKVAALHSGQTSSPTGMREEIVLLSWLIILLRTREGSQIKYDWAYKDQINSPGHEAVTSCLLMDEVITELQNNIEQGVAAAFCYVTKVARSQNLAMSSSVSLLLSTNSLSRNSMESQDEGVLHLEICYEDDHLRIRPIWYNKNMPQYSVARHIESLVDTIRTCISHPDMSIEASIRPTTRDLDDLWRLNHLLPPSYDFGMHEMISEQAQKYPEKVAISSWDGSLTYAQVEQYSTIIACSLKDMGVELHDVLPVCFEKSRWTIVAVLAVMKSGATFVLMDPTLPLARLQNMKDQVGAKLMLTSRDQYDLSKSILLDGKFIIVEEDTFTHSSSPQAIQNLAKVPSSALMYIIFTSGSTGTPKGVKISHGTYTSSAIPRAKAVGYTEDSRVLDFASYAFDVSIDSMLLTLGNGGCLCIPSDEDRLNDINGVIRKMGINYAGITPSVARILDPDVISSLSGLGLGGEAASARDVTLWGQDTRIIIGYGPCECTIGCTVNGSAATGRDYVSIGPGNGAAIWVVNPNDHDSLMPVGAVGELLVEGPIVGQGYLNDDEKTAAAFIKDPSWLLAGHNGYVGRQGRLYKTGDLGRYDPDGSGGIVFVGRKDTQVKLRGQRVELGEIESQLMARLPSDTNVIAEVIIPLGSGGQPMLVAFIASQTTKRNEIVDLELGQLTSELRMTLSEADADLGNVLPRYMVPTAYIPVDHIPVLISGKTDRKRLRQFGATVDLRQLDQGTNGTATRQLSETEQRLKQAWGQTLKLNPESIRPDDNFFILGGDSLAAMRLVSICREQGIDLTVASTFSHPTLSAMAGVGRVVNTEQLEDIPKFSMISQAIDSACLEASEVCGSDRGAIEDIYPCTPTQESLFTFSLKSAKVYVAQRVASVPTHIDIKAWKAAWEEVVAAIPILRTRLAQLREPGLKQVVLKESILWRSSTDLTQYLENDRNEKMDLGESLARYAIVHDQKSNKRHMVWTVHHVLYDGWSEPLILEKVSSALKGQHIDLKIQMKDFVKFVRNTDEVAMQDFWRQELKDAVGPQFPRLPSRDFLPTPDTMLERQISVDTIAGSPFTMATLIRGAWALVASQYTGSNDVVFGETLTGRDISLAGVESIIGPLIATVPVRINIDRLSTVESYLQSVQQGMLARTPYQHMGMQNIRKVSLDAQQACEAGTGLVIQPEPEYSGSELGVDEGDVVREALHFNPYPLMLACGVRKGGFRICANFDSALIEIKQMERILAQLEAACSQLTKSLLTKIGEISCLPQEELNQIWQWNRISPLSLDQLSGRLRADSSIKQGSTYPPPVVTWVCEPRNPSLLSPIGCVGELWLEGALLSGDVIHSPNWLMAGSSEHVGRLGKVQPTGDMVQLQDDGSLKFVSRKENVLPVQGHALDIAELEAHFRRYFPSTVRAAAAVFQSSIDEDQKLKSELAVFVEQQPSDEDRVKLMSVKYDIVSDIASQESYDMTLCAMAPISVALALKKLDKFIQDSLPSYMAPAAYVIVEKLPTDKGQVDHHLLNQLASKIPRGVLFQLVEGFKEVWTKILIETNLTATEDILRSEWAKLLGMRPEQIDVDDNFFRLGGDSVLAMKLVSSLRSQGHRLTVADIFNHMRLSDAAKVLKVGEILKQKPEVYTPFSTMGDLNIESFLSEIVRPKLADPSWSIRDLSPVTDSQALDIKATIKAPRTSIQYTMLYLDRSINREKLIQACKELVKSHDILRTIFIEHESDSLQVVIDDIDIPVIIQQAQGDIEEYVSSLCTLDIESDYSLGSSFFRMFYVEANDGQKCLMLGLSHAQYDGVSLPLLLQDLEILYRGEKSIESVPFLAYMSRINDEVLSSKAINYWKGLLDGSSLSTLDGPVVQHDDKSIFQAKQANISHRPEEITTANLLTAAWALILARRLQKPDVTFGSVTSGRNIDLSNVENAMGPCYQLTPIRVLFESQWTAMDLLRFVQRQSADSAAYDFLGFEKISKQCTQWSPDIRFFDSIVHHQDFEDFDTLPFAGGTCRVEISNPHGDAAHPIKAVTFVQAGQINVGVVGSERDPGFVDALLDELVLTIEELTNHSSDILLDGKLF